MHIDVADHNNVTPFLAVIQRGYVSMARTLLNLGANIAHTDKKGRSCLHYAVKHKDTSLLQLLFDVSRDIEYSKRFQSTASNNVLLALKLIKDQAGLSLISYLCFVVGFK